MKATASESPKVEVRCYRCDVSFPIGTKVCLHCGGRTGAPPVLSLPVELQEQDGIDPEDLIQEGVSKRSPLRLAVGGIWLLLALVGSLFRACTG